MAHPHFDTPLGRKFFAQKVGGTAHSGSPCPGHDPAGSGDSPRVSGVPGVRGINPYPPGPPGAEVPLNSGVTLKRSRNRSQPSPAPKNNKFFWAKKIFGLGGGVEM